MKEYKNKQACAFLNKHTNQKKKKKEEEEEQITLTWGLLSKLLIYLSYLDQITFLEEFQWWKKLHFIFNEVLITFPNWEMGYFSIFTYISKVYGLLFFPPEVPRRHRENLNFNSKFRSEAAGFPT